MTGTSLIVTMARKASMEPDKYVKTIRATVMPTEHTEEQFAAFMMVCHRYGLDPITREIYAYPARKGGGITPVVSIDGWLNLVNSHPACNGFEFIETRQNDGGLVSVTCTIWRKDRDHPVKITEHLRECYRNTDPWNQMPTRMLRHKALKEAARYAFGFAGIVDEDEASDIDRSVSRLERPIVAPVEEGIVNSLDHFAADFTPPVEEIADPDTGEVVDLWQDAVDRLLTMVTDAQVSEQGRLENLDQVRPAYEDALPIDKVRILFERMGKVARGEEKPTHARKYLMAM